MPNSAKPSSNAEKSKNIHATACLIGDKGVLIIGPSGSGKSTLAIQLIKAAGHNGQFGALIADDQLFISVANHRVVLTAPPAIAGKIELYGFGIAQTAFCSTAIVDLVVMLKTKSDIERMPEPKEYLLEGVQVPQLDLPMQSSGLNIYPILHVLSGKIRQLG